MDLAVVIDETQLSHNPSRGSLLPRCLVQCYCSIVYSLYFRAALYSRRKRQERYRRNVCLCLPREVLSPSRPPGTLHAVLTEGSMDPRNLTNWPPAKPVTPNQVDEMTQLIRDMRELLQRYAPLWYTEAIDQRVGQLLGNFSNPARSPRVVVEKEGA